LATLSRKHSVQDTLDAIHACSKIFDNYSADFIYAWPGHSVKKWEKELIAILKLGIPHLSLYQLTIEEGSVFGEMYSMGELLALDDETCAEMFELTQQITLQGGWPAYEISNHARPGFECKHNLGYWRYHDYYGVGPGAHSRICQQGRKFAYVQEPNPYTWIDSALENQVILEEKVELSLEEQAKEFLLVGLRMVEGVDCETLPLPLERIVNTQQFAELVRKRYLFFKGSRLFASTRGQKVLDALVTYLVR
jgi:oxygen-independent coproporphyrinogen-3 oxidase